MKGTYCQGNQFLLALLFGNFNYSPGICADKNEIPPIFDYEQKKIEHYFF